MAQKRTQQRPGAKGGAALTLPDDVLTDLRHVMTMFREQNQNHEIRRADLRSIMHNFGHYSVRQKEFEEELRKHNIDGKEGNFTEAEVITVITGLWYPSVSDSFLGEPEAAMRSVAIVSESSIGGESKAAFE